MKYLILCLLLINLYSCAGYRTTHFTTNSVSLGMKKESIIKKFGVPFKTDSYAENEKGIEVLYYKEIVDVSSYTYVLTSILLFEDTILTKITQEEEFMPDISIKTQSP